MTDAAARARRLVGWWCWAVAAFLVIVGAIGLFSEKVGPLPTNRAHAILLNLGVGLIGFGFARFGEEALYVLFVGIGMIVLALLGFEPATRAFLYGRLNMNMTESVFELVSGVISVGLWLNWRRFARDSAPP